MSFLVRVLGLPMWNVKSTAKFRWSFHQPSKEKKDHRNYKINKTCKLLDKDRYIEIHNYLVSQSIYWKKDYKISTLFPPVKKIQKNSYLELLIFHRKLCIKKPNNKLILFLDYLFIVFFSQQIYNYTAQKKSGKQ